MKRIITLFLVLSLVIVFAACGEKEYKEDIFNLVEENYDAIVTACENKDVDALLNIDGIEQVEVVDGYVLVYCKGVGVAPSSQYYGFYYSEENLPVAVTCSLEIVCYEEDLSPKENGYQCIVDGNTFYTEHIKGNIYFHSSEY